MPTLHPGKLLPGEQPAAPVQRFKEVLGAEERVALAQALPLALHVRLVLRVVPRHLLPVQPEVPPHAVGPLRLQVGLLGLLQQ